MKCLLCEMEINNLRNHIIDYHSDIQFAEGNDFLSLTDKIVYERYKRIGIYFLNNNDVKKLKEK